MGGEDIAEDEGTEDMEEAEVRIGLICTNLMIKDIYELFCNSKEAALGASYLFHCSLEGATETTEITMEDLWFIAKAHIVRSAMDTEFMEAGGHTAAAINF